VILALPDADHRIAVNSGATAEPPHGHLLPSERALPRNRSTAAAARPRNRSLADPARRFMVDESRPYMTILPLGPADVSEWDGPAVLQPCQRAKLARGHRRQRSTSCPRTSTAKYSKGEKNDYRDAEAIAEAVQRPTVRFGSWPCKNTRPRKVGEKPGPVRSQATIAAISGLAPTMFITRVRL
jgi:hypothetical protein